MKEFPSWSTHTDTHTFTHSHPQSFIHIDIHMHTVTHIYTHVHTITTLNAYTFTVICTHSYIHTVTPIYTHTHTHVLWMAGVDIHHGCTWHACSWGWFQGGTPPAHSSYLGWHQDLLLGKHHQQFPWAFLNSLLVQPFQLQPSTPRGPSPQLSGQSQLSSMTVINK